MKTFTTAQPNWQRAQTTKEVNTAFKKDNLRVQGSYKKLIEAITKLYSTKSNTVIYERNFKDHPNANPNAVHCFMTKDFYCYLCCEDNFAFSILYDIADNSLESKIKGLIAKVQPVDRVRKTDVKPSLAEAFKRCERIEHTQFFTLIP